MEPITLFDDPAVSDNLLPLTLTRPVARLRCGITTIAAKWRALTNASIFYITRDYLTVKYEAADSGFFIAGHVFPTDDLLESILRLGEGDAIVSGDSLIAFRGTRSDMEARRFNSVTGLDARPDGLYNLWDIFMKNGEKITEDFSRLTGHVKSQPLSDSCTLIGPADRLFIAEGASVEGAIINTKGGPVYIGRDAEVMEGSCLRGPIALCDNAHINMGTKVYGDTTIGPWCKVGGELNNVVMIGYSNKAHDGFLGNAVIGEWCNLGAGCVASNLKNDYTEIKLWNYPAHRFLKTGLQFCGLIMGDHSKAGINTMFNTATVVGVGVNIHGSGFPRTFIPSFSEGSTAGFTDVSMTKFLAIARRVMARRHVELTEADESIYRAILEFAENYK